MIRCDMTWRRVRLGTIRYSLTDAEWKVEQLYIRTAWQIEENNNTLECIRSGYLRVQRCTQLHRLIADYWVWQVTWLSEIDCWCRSEPITFNLRTSAPKRLQPNTDKTRTRMKRRVTVNRICGRSHIGLCVEIFFLLLLKKLCCDGQKNARHETHCTWNTQTDCKVSLIFTTRHDSSIPLTHAILYMHPVY